MALPDIKRNNLGLLMFSESIEHDVEALRTDLDGGPHERRPARVASRLSLKQLEALLRLGSGT